MDNYFKLANSIIREHTTTYSPKIEVEEEEIRSLDGFFSDEEAKIEDDEGLKKLGLTDDDKEQLFDLLNEGKQDG